MAIIFLIQKLYRANRLSVAPFQLDCIIGTSIYQNMKFVINEEERASKNYFRYFEQGKIYRIKGLLPRPLGNELDTELRLSRLYVREIISEGESNDNSIMTRNPLTVTSINGNG